MSKKCLFSSPLQSKILEDQNSPFYWSWKWTLPFKNKETTPESKLPKVRHMSWQLFLYLRSTKPYLKTDMSEPYLCVEESAWNKVNFKLFEGVSINNRMVHKKKTLWSMQPKFSTKYLEYLEATSFIQTKIRCGGIFFITPTRG